MSTLITKVLQFCSTSFLVFVLILPASDIIHSGQITTQAAQMPATKKTKAELHKYTTRIRPNLRLIENWCKDGLIESEICERLGVSYKSWQGWKSRYEELQNALKTGKEPVDYDVQNSLLKRALGYEYEETKTIKDSSGKVRVERTTKHVIPDTVACIFWLKNRQRDKWRDRWELEHSVSLDAVLSVLPPDIRELVKKNLAESLDAD